jgi:hypothetical protein
VSDLEAQSALANQIVMKSSSLSRSSRAPRNMLVVFDDLGAVAEGVEAAVRTGPLSGRGFVRVAFNLPPPRDGAAKIGLPSIDGWS